MNTKNQKGFIQIVIILVILALVGGAYYFGVKNKSISIVPTPVASIQPSSSPLAKPTADPTVNWKTYENATFGFSFLYPSELTVHNQLEQVGDNLLLQNFQEIPNRKENSGNFQLALYVSKDDGKVLDEYPKLWEKELGNLPVEKITIGNVTAIMGFSGQKYQAVPTVWLKNEGYLYTFQLSTPESTNKKLFDQILSTFRFTQ